MNPLADFSPLSLLIVDDDPLMSELVCDHYRDLGHRVRHAANGREALAALEAERPDIILCDRRMPEMSGAQLLENLRARGKDWNALVFVFVTGLSDRRDRYAMLPLDPDDYFCKPIDFAAADARLAEILVARRRGDPET